MTTQSLDLNLIPKGISPRLYVSQYDKGQTWTFNIYAGNTAYTIPNGATVTIQGTKPDKTGFQYSCTASGNVVTATEQQQMTVIAGEVSAEIRITNNNEIIATLNFILVVEPAALTDETEISETDLPIIEQAIEMFPHYQEMIDDVSSDIATLTDLVEGATEITTKSFSPVITVTDALPVNAVDVSAKIEPIQAGSGTPSPTNVRAISGRTAITVTRAGKNLVEETMPEKNLTDTGYISSDSAFALHIAKVKKGVTYSLGVGDSTYVYGFFTNKPILGVEARTYDGNRVVVVNTPTFIAPIDGYVAFRTYNDYTTPQCVYTNFIGSYETPNVNDYTIQLGDTYYGGTLDVTTGVLTVDKGISTIPTITALQTGSVAGKFMYYSINDMYLKDGSTPLNDCICEKLSYIPTINGQFGYYHLSLRFYVGVTNDYTVEEFNSEIAGSKVVYPLNNPFTVQLTPQEIQMLQGNNTIFTDSGDTSIQYYANSVKNLEASVSAIQNDTNDLKALTAIFGTFENGTTASKPYAQGDYFVKNNKMCKAKTSIAKGATLTLNTNYEEFTLAEILKTIETT